MRRWTTWLLTGVLIFSLGAQASAQTDFEPTELEGLQRAVARYWMAPVTVTESVTISEINEQGTPTAEYGAEWAPIGTPDPSTLSGTVLLAVLVAELETPGDAARALDGFNQAQQDQFRRDPRTPEMTELSLENVGDRAVAYTATQTQDGVALDYVYATVQDGSFVYSLTAQFVGLDVEDQIRTIMGDVIAAEAEPGDGEYRQDGTSTGGLWSKLEQVDPALVEESTVADIQIHPTSGEESVGASQMLETPRVDLDNPDTITGLESLHHRTYAAPEVTPTPDAPVSGVFRIDAYIMAFDTDERAAEVTTAVSNTLSDGIGVYASEGRASADDEGATLQTSISEGYIQDPSLPPGNAVVQVTQIDAMIYAVVVYAGDDTAPQPMANAVIDQMVGTAASDVPEALDSEGMSTGGVWERFPEAGEPVLEGLVPVSDANPVASDSEAATPIASPGA